MRHTLTTKEAHDRLLRFRDVRELTGLSEGFFRNQIARGALPVVRFGARALRVRTQDLDAFIEARRGR